LAIRVDTAVDKAILDSANRLKVIATGTTGVNHIDVDHAMKKGIEVISLQGANTTATAEHTIALLLNLMRNVSAAHHSLLSGRWQRKEFIGTQLHGKKLGVLGFGRIGQEVAKRAQAFGMQILAFDPYLPEAVFSAMGAVRMKTIEEALSEADAITLHVLLTEETKGFLNKDKLKLMKPNAIILNCSRGEVISEPDLISALEQKKIAGAALDVFSAEPLPTDSHLINYAKKHNNLILTPHIAGSTKEAIHEAGMFVAKKTQEFFGKEEA
ncbi:MAG: hydroxyacid dehydrogenase, partial [Nanoarchaeota archaeon]